MKRFKILLFFFSLVSFSAIWSQEIFTQIDKPIRVSSENPTVTIQLAANQTTGYQWTLLKYNENFVKSVEYQYIPSNSRLLGAPGIAQFKVTLTPTAFTAKNQIILNFIYKRPWEKKPGQSKKVILNTQ